MGTLVITLVAATTILVAAAIVARHRLVVVRKVAATPAVIDGLEFDAAEVLWSFRQVNESPHLSTIAHETVRSSTDVVTALNRTISVLPPEHASEIITAQLRLERTSRFRAEVMRAPDLKTSMLPALGDAAIVSLAAADAMSITDLAAELLAHKAQSALHLHAIPIPGIDHALESGFSIAADHTAALLAPVVDAHVPVVSLVMAIRSATTSAAAGLDADRVAENLAWDVGVKGGSFVAGASVGTLLFPGIGTLVGGVAGAIGGSFAAVHGKKRHLRSAMKAFRGSCAALGAELSAEHLSQVCEESRALIDRKVANLTHLQLELSRVRARRSWFSRAFRPTVGLAVAERAVALGRADIEVDQHQHDAMESALRGMSPSAQLRGYVWVASHQHLSWLTFNGPAPTQQVAALDQVRDETAKLTLAGH